MFETAVSSTVLILAVLLIRFACRGRISHRFLYALWLLVLARLLLPFPLRESPISVMNAVPQEPVEAASEPVPVQHINVSQDWTNFEALEPVNEPEPVRPASGGAEPQPAQPGQKTDHVTALDWLAFLRWLGTAAVGAVFLAENLLCARRLRKSRTPFRGEIHGCTLPVYVAESIPSPCLFGLIRPAVYLTPGAARDADAIPHILAHESTHYRHLDHIWPIFRTLAVALYWWNPLVWLAAHCSRVDCELACDEGALKILGEEQRFAYGRTLVGLVSVKKRPGALFRTATTMTGSKRELTQRIDMIVKHQKTALPILACAVLVAVAAVGCTFTGAEQGTAYNISQDPIEEDSPPPDVDPLEDAVHQAILDYNQGRYLSGEFACESHEILSTALVTDDSSPEGTPLTKVLAMVMYEEYNYQREEYDIAATGFQNVSGSHVPAVLTFREQEDGSYTLTDYWEPRDGSYYVPDLEKMCNMYFPDVSQEMLDPQRYVLAQTQNCYAQVIQNGRVNTEPIIADLFETMIQTPMPFSYTENIFEQCVDEYDQLMYFGDYTLCYIYGKYLQNESDYWYIMYPVMESLLGKEADGLELLQECDPAKQSPDQAYVGAWLDQLIQLRRNGMRLEEMREAYPKSALVFDLVGQQARQFAYTSDVSAPVKVVGDFIRSWTNRNDVTKIELNCLIVDMEKTAQVAENYFGSELAQSRGWTYETFTQGFLVVRSKYYVEYDHTKTSLQDGDLVQDFWVVLDPDSQEWTIVDSATVAEESQVPELEGLYLDGSQVIYPISGGDGTYQAAVETRWDVYDPRIEKITVDGPSGQWTLSDIVGWYDSAQWHLDGQLLSISYYGRLWRDFILLDLENSRVMYDGTLSFSQVQEYFQSRGAGMDYQPSEFSNIINMEVEQVIDADTLVIRYELECDTEGYTQSGTFRYHPSDGTMSDLQEQPPVRSG